MNHPPVGRHVLLDLFDCQCNPELLQFWSKGAGIVSACAKHFTILGMDGHQFQPTGWSATVLLSESHLSFHTWADLLFLSADLYTCGQSITDGAIQTLLDGFKPAKTVRVDVIRGLSHPGIKVETLGVTKDVQSFKR